MASEAAWPQVSVVVGNPPFVGDKKMRAELGDEYTEALRFTYAGRVPGGADLVCYWFEKARAAIQERGLGAAGFVATNSIRGGRNRAVLESIVSSTRIFDAWADQPWVNDGAAVRVSMIAFGLGTGARLDGSEVGSIYADLSSEGNATTGSLDLTRALPLRENAKACFVGGMKKGQFDVPGVVARGWLREPNPHGQSNAQVVFPWANGIDLTRRPSDTWIVDFGLTRTSADASLFAAPYAHVLAYVKPARNEVRNDLERSRWWLHARPAPELRSCVAGLCRFIGTARVAKHRLYSWLRPPLVVDGQLVLTARADDVTIGLLQSRFHEHWSLRLGTSLEDRPRYTPTTCFETFPFPVGLTPADTAHQRTEVVAADARGPHPPSTGSGQAKPLPEGEQYKYPPIWGQRCASMPSPSPALPST